MPARDSPATVVRVANSERITFAHEALNVISSETKVAMSHWVDELFHFETCFQVAFRPMELDVSVSQKIDLTCIRAVLPLSTDDRVIAI